MQAMQFTPVIISLNMLLVVAAACFVYLQTKSNPPNRWRLAMAGALVLSMGLSAGPGQLPLLEEELEVSLVSLLIGQRKPTPQNDGISGQSSAKLINNTESESSLSATSLPLRILLVDDQDLFREGMISLLEPQPDINVIGQATSVKEAIFMAHLLKPDVVLMEINLPDGTGIEAIWAILADRPETKVIALTIYDDDEHLFAAIRAGAAGYLGKSVSFADLLQSLQRVARGEAIISGRIARRVLEEFSRKSSSQDVAPLESTELTAREIEIVSELAMGETNCEIASKLVISEHTVRNHVHNVLSKLQLRNRRDIANYAHIHGLLPARLIGKPTGQLE